MKKKTKQKTLDFLRLHLCQGRLQNILVAIFLEGRGRLLERGVQYKFIRVEKAFIEEGRLLDSGRLLE